MEHFTSTSTKQLCFVHIGKTGGMSFYRMAAKNSLFKHVAPHYGSIAQLKANETPAKLAQYDFIQAHATFLEMKQLQTGRNKLYLSMLREPIDRTVSHYYFVRSSPMHHAYKLANELSIEDFVIADVPYQYEWRNYQTRLLSSTLKGKPDLQLALAVLEYELDWIGITEQYQESLDLLSDMLDWPQIQITHKHNVTKKRKATKELSQEEYNAIVEANQLDVLLYQRGVELFKKRLSLLNTTQQEPRHVETNIDTPSDPFRAAQEHISRIIGRYQQRITKAIQVRKSASKFK